MTKSNAYQILNSFRVDSKTDEKSVLVRNVIVDFSSSKRPIIRLTNTFSKAIVRLKTLNQSFNMFIEVDGTEVFSFMKYSDYTLSVNNGDKFGIASFSTGNFIISLKFEEF